MRLYVLESGQAANIVAVVCAVFPIVAYQSGLRRGGIYHPQAKFVVCGGVFIDGGPIDNARFHVAAGGLLPSFDCGYVDSANFCSCARALVDCIKFARYADRVNHAVLVAGNGHHAFGQSGNRVHLVAGAYGRVHLDASEDVEGVCRYLIVEDAVNCARRGVEGDVCAEVVEVGRCRIHLLLYRPCLRVVEREGGGERDLRAAFLIVEGVIRLVAVGAAGVGFLAYGYGRHVRGIVDVDRVDTSTAVIIVVAIRVVDVAVERRCVLYNPHCGRCGLPLCLDGGSARNFLIALLRCLALRCRVLRCESGKHGNEHQGNAFEKCFHLHVFVILWI